MSDRGSEPAYPTIHGDSGMTIREGFASRAMQGLLANVDLKGAIKRKEGTLLDSTARIAVCSADVLLRELEKGGSDEEV